MTETFLAPILCSLILGGTSEEPHAYSVGYNLHSIRVDCETDTHVIEVGLDKRSSLDSVHQAVFAAQLTGKAPMVVVIDTDGREDQYELQVRMVAGALGIPYAVYDEAFLIRWQMTSYLRNLPPVVPVPHG